MTTPGTGPGAKHGLRTEANMYLIPDEVVLRRSMKQHKDTSQGRKQCLYFWDIVSMI